MSLDLIDSNVILYLDGGFKIAGIISDNDSDRVYLDTEDGLMIIERSKISGILLPLNKKEVGIDQVIAAKYNKDEPIEEDFENIKVYEEEYYEPPLNNLGQENHYGSVLPSDMLLEDGSDEPQVSFSISMSSLINADTKLDNKVKDDSSKEA